MKFTFFVFLFYYSTKLIDGIDVNLTAYNIWTGYDDIYTVDNRIFNCTKYIVKTTSSCVCLQCTVDKRIVCCTNSLRSCCYDHKCDGCWDSEMRFISVTHISIFILFLFGTAAIIALFFKIRYRAVQMQESQFPAIRTECNNNENSNIPHCCTMQSLRDRPPPYIEACGAPPLYGSPSNMVSMSEAPPAYPGTTQSSIVHHM